MAEEIKDTKREIKFIVLQIQEVLDGFQRQMTGLKETINYLGDLHERLNDQETINENN